MNIKGINATMPEPDILLEASHVLSKMGIVMAPTETKYGLLGRIDQPGAIRKIYELKNRSRKNPTAIFVRSVDEMSKYGTLSDQSRRIADNFLPGPLTIIIKAKPDIEPPLAVDGKIGLRYSSSAVITGLLKLVDFDITATSANISGSEDIETIDKAAGIFGDKIDMYLDAGNLNAPASTVIDCSGNDFRILRSGIITEEMISSHLELN